MASDGTHDLGRSRDDLDIVISDVDDDDVKASIRNPMEFYFNEAPNLNIIIII